MDLSYQYMKKRCNFGKQPMFCEQGPDMCDSIATDVTQHKAYILRNPVHQPTQNTPSFSQHEINTIRAEYTISGANHAEGGWPKDVVVTDPEATQRYRRKIEKDDNYVNCVMSLSPSMANANGVSVIEYEPTIPTRFMVGTDNGLVISGNRKGKTPMEKLQASFLTHLGPVWSLERNPGFLKNFMTVGDWTARVWSEDCRESAVLWTSSHRHRVTAGCWSPTRLSLMELVGADGKLSLWDLLRRQHEPILTMQVCKEPLVQLKAHEGGSLIALGSYNGCIYMAELSMNLTNSEKNDKALLTAIFERESKREKILEARLREIKLKLRQAEEGSITGVDDPDDPSIGDKDIHEATTEYMLQVKKELSYL